MMCLPPHTMHESQPFDASVFKPLKLNWHNACHKFVQRNPGKVITKYDFSPLLHETWNNTMILTDIVAGFRRSGIYPINPKALDYGASKSMSHRAQVLTANSNVNSQAASSSVIDAEPLAAPFTEEHFQR